MGNANVSRGTEIIVSQALWAWAWAYLYWIRCLFDNELPEWTRLVGDFEKCIGRTIPVPTCEKTTLKAVIHLLDMSFKELARVPKDQIWPQYWEILRDVDTLNRAARELVEANESESPVYVSDEIMRKMLDLQSRGLFEDLRFLLSVEIAKAARTVVGPPVPRSELRSRLITEYACSEEGAEKRIDRAIGDCLDPIEEGLYTRKSVAKFLKKQKPAQKRSSRGRDLMFE